MKPILLLFWHICRLKQSPEHVPTHTWFVLLVIIANLVGSLIVSGVVNVEFSEPGDANEAGQGLPLLATATGIVVGQTTTAVLTWLILQMRELGDRFFATITAMFGCDLLITACFGALLPLLSLIPSARALVFLLFLIWSISVMGFILHRSLQVQLAVGIMIAVGISIMGLAMSEVAIAG
jgi:hypothetical protein